MSDDARVEVDRETLLVVLAVAALAPLLADLPTRVRIPIVVAELVLGIVVGPDVLGIAKTSPMLDVFKQLGLAFLFFLAGMEIEFDRVRGAPAKLAARGWALSLVIGLAAGGVLYAVDLIGTPVLVGLAMTTTALGAMRPDPQGLRARRPAVRAAMRWRPARWAWLDCRPVGHPRRAVR